MKLVLKILGALLLVLVLAAGAGYLWVSNSSDRILSRTIETHTVDFQIPFPLTEEEIAEAEASDEDFTVEEGQQLALERAVERGRHLVEARYFCVACHGDDFSGGVMVDVPILGRLLGPNLTSGAGSRTADYSPADWDRTVRHGVLPDGRPSAMPAEDFQRVSDQELSDVVAYIGSFPPVDNEVPSPTLGPLGKFLMTIGALRLSADLIESHDASHTEHPPPAEASTDFGRHLAGTCFSCHSSDLAGGPILGGDPAWGPAANLTPHADGIGSWTFEQFDATMRTGIRPDGTAVLEPMSLTIPYTQNMTDVEMEALWLYLQSVPAVASEG